MTGHLLLDEAVALHWIDTWDQQQRAYLPRRDEQFDVVARLVRTVAGSAPRVLDLGCGPGSLGRALRERAPGAQVTGVDRDPVLLALATAHERAGWLTLVSADLQDASWTSLVDGPFDAVVAATALHWLAADRLESTYAAVHGLLRPGGVFVNSDTMPAAGAHLAATTAAMSEAVGGDAWAQWWRDVEAEPGLAPAVARRTARPAHVVSAEFTPPAQWHLDALSRAGFAESDVVWRCGSEAVVAAVAT
jgi:trans-aconitate methyltransferase